jgi:hypothetical protein
VLDFSSTIFMDSTPPRLTNRNRVDQWLLLALRAMILLSLAFAFARPFLKMTVEQNTSDQIKTERILLIDVSASMRRDGIWEQAIQKSEEYTKRSKPDDTIAVYSMTDRIVPLVSLEQSRGIAPLQRISLADKSLQEIVPTWYAADIGRCMLQALELFKSDETDGDSKTRFEIAVVSDFQQGGSIEALASTQWPSDIPFVPILCTPRNPGNATLSVLPRSEVNDKEEFENIDRVMIRNGTRSKVEKFQLSWLDANGSRLPCDTIDAMVPAGQQQILSLRRPEIDSSSPDSPLILELDGDQDEFDNRQYLFRGKKATSKVVCVDSQKRDPKDSLWYFAVRVPLSKPGLEVDWVTQDPSATFQQEQDLNSATKPDWVIASSEIRPEWAEGIRGSIEEGLHLFWVMDRPVGKEVDAQSGDVVDPERMINVLRAWFPSDSIDISEAAVKRFQLLQDLELSHPIFAPFADPKYNDFTKIRFWRHRRIVGVDSDPWRILAKFDDGDPAILQRSLGKGTITVMTSGWQPSESQLALSSKFVPILASLFEQARPSETVLDYRCGDRIPRSPGTDLSESNTESDRFERPGFTSLASGADIVAVNIPRSEGLTDPMNLDEFARFGIPLDSRMPIDLERETASKKNQIAEQLEASQRGWWWILLLVVIFAGLESLISAYRCRVGPAQATSS